MVPLPLGPVVFLPGRGRQRVQHGGDRGGALGGQVPVHDPGAADGGGQLHLPVRELPARVLIRQVPAGPHEHLREQARQIRQPQASGERGEQLLIAQRPGARRGSLSVHRQITRADRLRRPCPAASAASTREWVAARLAHALCPTAAPRVIPVRWISQDTAL